MVRGQNYEQLYLDQYRFFEVINTLEWFPRWTRFGSHDLKLVSRYLQKTETFYGTVPGDRKIVLNGGIAERQQEYFSNDPRLDGQERHGYFIRAASGTLLINSLSDSIRLGPLRDRQRRAGPHHHHQRHQRGQGRAST